MHDESEIVSVGAWAGYYFVASRSFAESFSVFFCLLSSIYTFYP
jgi:hypothetical protein